jgi:hypothetical protein
MKSHNPVLSGGPGSINGTVGTAPLRVGSGSGSFSSGTPRAFQFGIRVELLESRTTTTKKEGQAGGPVFFYCRLSSSVTEESAAYFLPNNL